MRLIANMILLLLLPGIALSQLDQKQLYSLHQELAQASNDTIRMQRYYNLGWAYLEINHDSSLYYFNKALPIARNLNLQLNETDILGLQGYLFMKLGDLAQSLESHLLAIKIANDPDSEDKIWPKGMSRLEKLSWNYHHIYAIYERTGNRDKAIASLLESRRIASSVQNEAILAFVDAHLGEIYIKTDQLDSALVLEERALKYFSNSSFWSNYEGNVLNYIGDIHLAQGNLSLARETLLRASKISEQRNNVNYLGDSYLSLARLYKVLKKADSCLLFAKRGFRTYQILNNSLNQTECLRLIGESYERLTQRDSALYYFKSALVLNDSLKNVEVKNLLAFQNVGFEEQQRLEELEKERTTYLTKIRTNTLLGSLFTVVIVALFLFRNNRQKQKARQHIEKAYDQLKSTQSQLIQSEKMASLGELTAGIAHEIQNPLNFVNNFSEVNTELIDELKKELAVGNKQLAEELVDDIKSNSEKINHHGKRAGDIVKGMLQHSRSSSGIKEPTNINALADEYLRLAYHGLRAKDKSFNATMKTDFDISIGNINVVPQDIGRVILNLITNAFYVVNEKAKTGIENYEPTVTVSTIRSLSELVPQGGREGRGEVKISVKDNGNGIPDSIKEKIFQPFFTTKPTGQGTGLGLSLSYDIVKAHGGELKVETKEGEGSEFTIQLQTN